MNAATGWSPSLPTKAHLDPETQLIPRLGLVDVPPVKPEGPDGVDHDAPLLVVAVKSAVGPPSPPTAHMPSAEQSTARDADVAEGSVASFHVLPSLVVTTSCPRAVGAAKPRGLVPTARQVTVLGTQLTDSNPRIPPPTGLVTHVRPPSDVTNTPFPTAVQTEEVQATPTANASLGTVDAVTHVEPFVV